MILFPILFSIILLVLFFDDNNAEGEAAIGNSFQKVMSDGYTVGVWKLQHPNPSAPVIFIFPGLTSIAFQWLDWMSPLKERHSLYVIDYRGFGLSMNHHQSNTAPDRDVYGGFSLARAAADAKEIMEALNLSRPIVLGHSFGVNVILQYVQLFDTSSWLGAVLMDEGALMIDRLGGDPTYPSNYSTFHVVDLRKIDILIAGFSENSHKIEGRDYFYPNVLEFQRKSFLPVKNENGVIDENVKSFCFEQSCLDNWASGTNAYADMNGRVYQLWLWAVLTIDCSSIASQLRQYGQFPVFVYGGENSIVPSANMEWLYNKLYNETRLDRLYIAPKPYGTHIPWLNPEPYRSYFFSNLTTWMGEVMRFSTHKHSPHQPYTSSNTGNSRLFHNKKNQRRPHPITFGNTAIDSNQDHTNTPRERQNILQRMLRYLSGRR